MNQKGIEKLTGRSLDDHGFSARSTYWKKAQDVASTLEHFRRVRTRTPKERGGQ